LRATYPQFEIDGVADGVLGKCVSGLLETPFLVVIEAKRGLAQFINYTGNCWRQRT